jgi:hypothetical protein
MQNNTILTKGEFATLHPTSTHHSYIAAVWYKQLVTAIVCSKPSGYLCFVFWRERERERGGGPILRIL